MKDQKRVLLSAGLVAALISPQLSLANDFINNLNPQKFRANIDISIPNADDNWDTGYGFRGQIVLKPSTSMPDYMVGLSLGFSTWDANDDVVTLSTGNAASGRLSGDATITELGLSIMRSKPLKDNFMLLVEAGTIFQNFSSDVELTYTYTGVGTTQEEVDLDSNLLLFVGADVTTAIANDTSAFFGVGYQLDLFDGDASAFSDEVENKAGAFKLRAGLEFNF